MIGRCPAADEPRLQPRRRGPDRRRPRTTRAVKRGQRSGSSTTISIPAAAARRPAPGSSDHGGGRQRRAGRGVDLARDAVDAEAVGPVRRDLELEHVGRDREHVGQRRARARRRSSSTRIPAWSVPIASSSSARIIPFETTPRSFAAPSFVPSGITAPGRATATVWPGGDVRRAADDLRGSPSPTSTWQTRQPVGVRVLLGAEHAPDDEVRAAAADAVVVDPVDLGAGHRRAASASSRTPAGRARRTRAASRAGASCRTAPGSAGRCRRSRRRSGTPCLSIAIRSMPIPNAKPWIALGVVAVLAHVARTRSGRPSRRRGSRASPCPCRACSARRRPSVAACRRTGSSETSTSTLGSVNGKKCGRRRTSRSSPKIARANASSVPLRSASVMSSSTASPSTWWNCGVCVASLSRR